MCIRDRAKAEWVRHWLAINFSNLEQQLARHAALGPFVYGAQPGIVDCCLVPHAYAATRYELDLSIYPILSRILEHCHVHPAFIRAHPGRQPDTPEAFQLLP
jgi:glutathione S-transferase